MTQQVLLNALEHQTLRVLTGHSAALGDNQWFSPTFPLEFRSCAASYPLFFYHDTERSRYLPVALFGFCQGENLFLADGWREHYVPLSMRRQPFLIGRQQIREDGVVQEQRVLHIDLAHPRVSTTDGEPLFLPFGGQSPFLQDMAGLLETLHLGMQDAQQFVELLQHYQLIEGVTLDLTLKDGNKHQLVGFATIAEDKLAALDGDALAALHQRGYLQAVYLMLASQSRLRQLIERKQQQSGLC